MRPGVTIDHLALPEWSTATDESYQTATITIWRAKVQHWIPVIDKLEKILDPEEKSKAIRFHQKTDQQRFIISKAVLRILLSRYLAADPKEIRFESGKNKKPELKNNFWPELHFNISHSGNWILIAISNQQIGIDVEEMNAFFNYKNLLPFSFSREEAAFIENSDLPYNNFYRLWTRKESLLKATGKGLVDQLSHVPSLIGVHPNPTEIIGSKENWQVLSFPVDENHAGSVAFMPVKTALQFFNFRL